MLHHFLGQDFCHPLSNTDANPRNAQWFPESCTSTISLKGGRCFFKCKAGYKLVKNSLASVDCINHGSTTWGSLGSNICERSIILIIFFTLQERQAILY